MKATHIIFSIALFLWSGLATVWAHNVETIVKRAKANLSTNTSLAINDPNRNDPGLGTDYVVNYTAVVALVYGRGERSDIAGQAWDYDINYNLVDIDNSIVSTGSLHLEHSNEEGVYESVVAHKQVSGNLRIQVTSITGPSNVPNDIHLELRLQTERYNYLNALAVPTLTVGAQPTAQQQSEIRWPFIDGAEYYELEWVYWDKENDIDATQLSEEELFEQAASIQTSENYYTLDMIYPDGDVYFRIRPVGRFIRNVGTDYSIEKRGKWSLAQKVELQNAFEKDRNWSFARSYAEEGKYKQAISYFDDGMKGRQSLTNLSSEDITVIAESVYDVENRASLAIMPVPVSNKDITNGSYLAFGAGTGPNNGLITTGDVAYSRKDFDVHNINGNTSKIPQLPANHIANQYYSSANPFNTKIHRDYVPDAEGYPIAQVHYDNDSRGYVKSQSGVGSFYQIENNGRANRYFYVKPTNTELISLFGDNVGDAKYYRKNYAIDANGQAAVSIVDQAGMTVMTALAGQIPANVHGLDGTVNQRHESIIGGNTVLNAPQQSVLTHPLFCDHDGANYDFTYDLEQAVNVTNSKHNVCIGCTYDLEIKVEDEHGNIIPCVLTTSNPDVTVNSGIITASYVSGQNPCTGNNYTPTIAPIDFSVTFPVLGAYTVYKTLTTTGPDADDILAQLQANGTIVDEQTFIDNYVLANFDSTECSGCSDAQRQELCERIILDENPNLDLTDPADFATYQALIEDCIGDTITYPCDGLLMAATISDIMGNHDCETILDQMKQQLSPGGCLYDVYFYSDALNDSDPYFNIPTIQDAAGNDITDDATAVAMIENLSLWQDSWVDELVVLHPEYCRYLDCINNPVTTASKLFDIDLANYTNWHDAATDLGLTVSNPTTDADKRAIITAIVTADPYISTAPNTGNGQNPMQEFMDTYCTIQCGNVTTPCACNSSTPDIIDFLSPTGAIGSASAPTTEEDHWILFRGAYANEKLNIIYANQCPLKKPADLGSEYPSPTCQEITGEPLFNITTSSGGTTTVGLTGGINTYDDLVNLVNSNIYGNGANANPTTPSLCGQLCEARVEGWIELLCPGLNALASDPNADPTLVASYNAMKSQLENYCMTGCGLTTAPTVPTGNPYLANPLGYLIEEDLTKPPFTGPTGVLAIIDTLQASPFFECNSGTSSSTLLGNIAVSHSTIYQLNITYNNVYANLPVQNPKCDLLKDVFTVLDNDLFPVRFSDAAGTVPHNQSMGHASAPTANIVGIPSQQEFTSVPLFDAATGLNSISYFSSQGGRAAAIYLNNKLDDNLNPVDRFIRIIGKKFDDPCDNELGFELLEAGSMQPINPLEIVSIGTYDCTTNMVSVEIMDQSCAYPNNNPGLNSTACTSSATQTVTAFVRINIDPCIPSWEQQADSTWVPITNEVSIDFDQALTDCYDAQVAELTQEATYAYQGYVNSVVNDVLQDVECMPVVEKMDMSYESTEQHYTLYYYDQVGNLVHTLPPAAVKPMDMSSYQAGDNPAHDYELLTTYTYNSLGQVIAQESPDGGLSHFYYDYAQRLRLSQNARQAPTGNDGSTYGTGGDYAYTKFDRQGRLIEVGKLENYNALANIEQLNNIDFPNNTHTLSEQTITVYDEAVGTGTLTQENLRSRVATTYNDEIATHYTYDIHGNVSSMQHQIKKFGVAQIDYDYDLITGNVNEVAFQKGTKDQFFHRYSYDADNRLTKAKTSKNGYSWDTDARYFYYAHGPLARVEIGNDKVQGMDYYYNLQGWLKGVNNTTPYSDMGLDAYVRTTQNDNQWFGKDEVAFHLGYHKGDYKPIGGNIMGIMEQSATNVFDNELLPAAANGNGTTGLYNGNITFMITHIPELADAANNKQATNAMVYQYDALHRIKKSKSFHFDQIAGQWKRDLSTEWYDTDYTYDANGNLQDLVRYNKGTLIDDLHYKYHPTNKRYTNQLQYVEDNVAAVTVGDFENQGQNNYEYDLTGNLIKDASQNIDAGGIQWNLMNKIDKVTYSTASGKTPLEFTYDAGGSRLTKTSIVNNTRVTTVYIKDAASNIIATYEMVDEQRDNPIEPGQTPITFPQGASVYAKKLTEVMLYGASRLGVRKIDPDWSSYVEITQVPIDMSQRLITFNGNIQQDVSTRGDKLYEAANHLGNVLITFSDKKLGKIDNLLLTKASRYEAIVTTASDYYPFGWQMPNRKLNSQNYSFAFNGQLTDSEWMGGQSTVFEFRTQDTRLGRFLSTDPLAALRANQSPYVFGANNPIWNVDYLGLIDSSGTGDPQSAIEYSGSTEVVVKAAKMTDSEAASRKGKRGGITQNQVNSKMNNRTFRESFSKARSEGRGADFDKTFATTPIPNSEWGGGLGEYADPIGDVALIGIGGSLALTKGVSMIAGAVGSQGLKEALDFAADYAWETTTGTPSPFIFGVADLVEAGGKRFAKKQLNTCRCGVICFVGGTKVLAVDSLENIETLELGDLVTVSLEHTEVPSKFDMLASANSNLAAIYRTKLDAGTWRSLNMYMPKENGDTLFIELLRPNWWVDKYINQVGDDVYLTLEEMAVSGQARVTAIGKATFQVDTIRDNKRPIIGKFTNKTDGIFRLRFEGLEEAIGVTSKHPIWSVTRDRWVDAENLEEGELARTNSGTTIKLLEKEYEPETHTTYNIEVYDAHNYFVSDSTILVHNTGGNPCDFGDAPIGEEFSGVYDYMSGLINIRKSWDPAKKGTWREEYEQLGWVFRKGGHMRVAGPINAYENGLGFAMRKISATEVSIISWKSGLSGFSTKLDPYAAKEFLGEIKLGLKDKYGIKGVIIDLEVK